MRQGKEHAFSTLMKMRKEELVQRFMTLEHNLNVKQEFIERQAAYIEELQYQLDAVQCDEEILS